jgi:hypothetical protein
VPDSTTIHVQSILYRTSLGDIWRFMRGLSATIKHARSLGVVSTVGINLGDCSPEKVLGEADLAELRSLLEPIGDIVLEYSFFNENRMTAYGHNSLAANATADFLMIVNPDTYAAPDMLAKLIGAMSDPVVGMAEARQIPIEHPKDYDVATGETCWASTCCVLVRRSVFEFLGGFDQKNFPLYCDDVDFSWRVRLNYSKVVFVPDASVFHDKHLAGSGTVVASEVEQYYGAFARLMLARRYDRPDIEQETTDFIEDHGNDALKRGLREFELRVASGDAPEKLPRASHVAEFVGGEYALHRY